MKTKNILYILYIELEGKQLVKIGVTSRNIEDRVSEILVSIFKVYREFPYTRPKRFKKTTDVYKKEKALHTLFKSRRYKTAKKFSGHTEFFDITLDEAVAAYENLLKD